MIYKSFLKLKQRLKIFFTEDKINRKFFDIFLRFGNSMIANIKFNYYQIALVIFLQQNQYKKKSNISNKEISLFSKIFPNVRRKSEHSRFCHDTSSLFDVYNKMGRYVRLKEIIVRLSGIIEQMGVLTSLI